MLRHQITKSKSFVSRLGEEIKKLVISDDDRMYAVLLRNNEWKLINSDSYSEAATITGPLFDYKSHAVRFAQNPATSIISLNKLRSIVAIFFILPVL